MKFKLILSAALMAIAICVRAANENAAAAVASTNTDDAMKALFGDPDIAKGTGFTIKRSELDEVVSGAKANAAAQGQELPPGFDASVLDQLISTQVLLQKATDADRAAGQTDADKEYALLVKHAGSPEAFQRQLQAVGITVAELRSKATQEATAIAALKRILSVTVTDAELETYYTNHPSDFEVPETVHVRHILLMTVDASTRPPTPLSTNTIAQKRKQIEDLLKRARGGEDFATLAKEFSEDPGSKDEGGELPAFPRGQMVPEFEAAAFSLTNNEISDVITTVYGFHIIKLIDKKPSHKLVLTEKSPSNGLTITEELREALINQKVKKLAPGYVKQLRSEYKVEILDPTLKAEDDAAAAAADSAAADDVAGPASGTAK
ncbi:MAG: peptidylprolyl isomerase [Verrucomicrobiota bacterium]|jgi:parvulin-like peptidyl-prolyl isomerase